MNIISEEQWAQYDHDGFLKLGVILDKEEVLRTFPIDSETIIFDIVVSAMDFSALLL